ncbi:MAG: HD-GYP domain-containing protein [Clostridia bacterium]|nr:HD-GYP domain-containing protein [Clostridia bacterium]
MTLANDFTEVNKYKTLIMVEDSSVLSKVISAVNDIKTADVLGITDTTQMVSILKNDHTFDILVMKCCDELRDTIETVKDIRKHNTSIFVILLCDEYMSLDDMDSLSRYNVQGYCKDTNNYEELKIWIHSGIRILEQTKMLKQLYVQTKNQAETIKTLNTKLSSSYYETIDTLRKAVDKKDPYTRGHSDRVGYISAMIAETMGLTDEEIDKIRLGGQFHDIGKIGIKDNIITKPDRLTDEEYDEIKKHPIIGYELLEKNNIFKDILPAIRSHHEKYDGTGYPDGLAGNKIPLMARIVCVADSFDAMMSKRSYRDKMDLDYTMNEIERCKGTQFDPKVAEAFKVLMETRYDEIIGITGEY